MSDYPSFGQDWRKRWVQINSEILHRTAMTVSPSPEQRAATEAMYAAMFASVGAEDKSPEITDEWEMDGLIPIGIQGTTACGLSGRLSMPGIFSRIGAPRCKKCCRKVGIPDGNGAPYNDEALAEELKDA